MLWHTLIFVVLIQSQVGIKAFSNKTYTGGVVQYHLVYDNTNTHNVTLDFPKIIENYKTIIANASSLGIDIIVFPEYGLIGQPHFGNIDKQCDRYKTGFVSQKRREYKLVSTPLPDPKDLFLLCNSTAPIYKQWLKDLSCSAKENKIYVVLNIVEWDFCNPSYCLFTQFQLYNTNIVFDREGRLIARYRKFNLFCEPWFERTDIHELSKFTTDFNVTFMQLIDIDVLNSKSLSEIFDNNAPDVTDIVHSSVTFDILPFYVTPLDPLDLTNSLLKKNVLSSNLNGGSGIYRHIQIDDLHIDSPHLEDAIIYGSLPIHADKRITQTHRSTLQRQVLYLDKFTDVRHTQLVFKAWRLGDYFTKKNYVYEELDFNENYVGKQLCIKGMCCDFFIEMSFNKTVAETPESVYYRYKLVAISKYYNLPYTEINGIEMCLIMSCIDENIENCGQRYPKDKNIVEPLNFHWLVIQRKTNPLTAGNFAAIAIRDNGVLMSSNEFQFYINHYDGRYKMTLHTNKSFAIVGVNARRFDMTAYEEDKEVIIRKCENHNDKDGLGYFGYGIIIGFFIGVCFYYGKKFYDKKYGNRIVQG